MIEVGYCQISYFSPVLHGLRNGILGDQAVVILWGHLIIEGNIHYMS
jgi:hypothetical protein